MDAALGHLGAVAGAEGFGLAVGAVLVAGIVYGFAGFGAALIAIPVLARVAGPEAAVIAFGLAGLGSALTMLPRVWPEADRPATLWMLLAASVTAPFGLWLLVHGDPTALRWGICALAAVTLLAVASGRRLRLSSGPAARLSLGAVAGAVGGATGLTGPAVILVNLASGDAAARMRANLASFLTLTNFIFLPVLALMGALTAPALALGAWLLPVYLLGTEVGARLHRPGRERLYRAVAYAVVGAAIVTGLPLFD